MDFGVGGFDGLVGSGSGSCSLPENKQKWYGSGFIKQERSATVNGEDDWRTSKLAKTAIFSDALQHQQMLSFSSPHQSDSFPYFHHSSPAFNRSTGYGYGGLSSGSMPVGRGPFTPSQWMELEHQALIYKYITANVPIPSNLLIPIRKAFDSAGFSSFSGGLLRPNSLGWGSIHLGFSNSDPEVGRCRRTDGKKWRCSRDAVADQKYCERHMNRGRHRSRKPVEGQTGHSVSGTTTTTTAKMTPVVSGAGASNGRGKSDPSNLSAATSGISKENTFVVPKLQIPFGESSISEFGLVNCKSFCSSQDLNEQQTESQHSLRQFIDDWPKNQSDQTELSISIPMASSPDNEKVTLSPLRLAFNPVQMGLGVGSMDNESNGRQANWIPISWENSMGGPLGEVLHSTNNNVADCKNSAALHLMMEGWDNSSSLGSSPTGVLQKTAFGSLSSSAGSSPRAENRSHEGAAMCDDLLGTTFGNSSSLPAM